MVDANDLWCVDQTTERRQPFFITEALELGHEPRQKRDSSDMKFYDSE